MKSSRKNIFHEIYEKANSSKELPAFPYFIDIELTNKCNFSCGFCNRQFMKRKQGLMSNELFDNILVDIESEKTPIRFIRWGEPFLHPKILDFSCKLTERGIPVHITTNGSGTIEKLQQLVDIGVDSVIFSMQGTNEEEYNSSRMGGDYNLLKDKIVALSEYRGEIKKPYITVTTTISEDQGKDKKKFIDYWSKYVDDVKIGTTNLSKINGSVGKHIICKRPWQQLNIDWDGEVTACCNDYDKLMSVGNMYKSTLIDMWNGKILNAYRILVESAMFDSLSLCKDCYPAYGNIWKS